MATVPFAPPPVPGGRCLRRVLHRRSCSLLCQPLPAQAKSSPVSPCATSKDAAAVSFLATNTSRRWSPPRLLSPCQGRRRLHRALSPCQGRCHILLRPRGQSRRWAPPAPPLQRPSWSLRRRRHTGRPLLSPAAAAAPGVSPPRKPRTRSRVAIKPPARCPTQPSNRSTIRGPPRRLVTDPTPPKARGPDSLALMARPRHLSF